MPNLNIAITIDSKQAEEEIKRLEGMFRSMIDTFDKSRKTFGLGDETIKETQKLSKSLQGIASDIKGIGQTTQEISKVTSQGFTQIREEVGKTQKSFMGLQWNLKSIFTDVTTLINFQMRWYLARALVFAPVDMAKDVIKSGIEYTKVLDDARIGLLRWGATSGKVTAEMREDVNDLVLEMRKTVLVIPIQFEKLREGAEAFVGAGIDPKVVKANLDTIAILMSNFSEINMNQFAIAISGAMKVFGISMKDIIEQLLKAQQLSIIRPEQFVGVLQYMSEMGKAAGFTTTQILAMAAGLADTGMQANRLARLTSSLWASFTQEKAIKALHSIGIEIDKNKTLAEQFFPILEKMKKALGMEGGAISVGAMTFLSNLTSKDQLRDLVALMDKLDVIKKYIEDIGGSTGSLEALNKEKLESISGQWELLKNKFREISKDVSAVNDIILDLLKSINDLADAFIGLVGPVELIDDRLAKMDPTLKLISSGFLLLKTGLRQLADLLHLDFQSILAEGEDFKKRMDAMWNDKMFVNGMEVTINEMKKLGFEGANAFKEFKKAVDEGKVAYTHLSATTGYWQLIPAYAAPKAPPKAPPPPPPPDLTKIKDYHSQIINATKQYYHALLDIEKVEESLSLSILEDQYRMGLVTITDYYEQRQKLTEASTTKERELLAIEAQEITATYLKAVKNTKINVKPENLMEALKALRIQYDATITGIQAKDIAFMNKMIQDQNRGLVDMTMRSRQIFQNDLQSRSKIEQDIIQQRYDAVKDSYQEEETLTKWLYDQKLISATDYFNKLTEINDKGFKADLERLYNEYNAFLQEKGAEIDYLYSQGVIDVEEYDKRNREINERYQKWFGDREKMIRDHTSKEVQLFRDASINIQKIYEDQGTTGVIAKAMDDTEKEWSQTWDYLYKKTKEVYEGLSQSFSDIFFDGITGKLKSLKDYFKSIFDSILRYFTDMLGRMMAMNLQEAIMGKWISSTGTNITQYVGAAGGLTSQQAIASGATQQGGLLSTGGALSGISPYILPALGGGLIGSQFGGYGGIGGALGGIGGAILLTGVGTTGMGLIGGGLTSALMAGGSGAMSGALAGSVVPIIGTIIGAVLGGLLGSLFGGGTKHYPKMAMGYGVGEGGLPEGKRWFGTSKGGYMMAFERMDAGMKEFGEATIYAFKTIREKTKTTLEDLGLDVSGFAKLWWKDIKITGEMTGEEIQAMMKDWMGEYISFASGIDFEKFRKEGEKVADTIDLMITAMASIATIVKPKWDEATKSGWDISKMYDNINLHANTYKEALDKTDKKIYDNITAMNDMAGSEAFDPETWRKNLEEIGILIQDRYKLEIEYLTYIKTLQEEVKTKIAAQIEKYTVDQFTTMAEQWGYVVGKLAKDWDSFINETDPTKIAILFNSITNGIDQLYGVLISLKGVIKSLQDAVHSTRESMKMDLMSDKEKVDYINKQINAEKTYYDAAKAARSQYALGSKEWIFYTEKMTKHGTNIERLAGIGWGIPGIDKAATLKFLDPILAEIETDMKTNADLITDIVNTVIIPALQSFADTINTKLVDAINAEIVALDRMRRAIGLINYAPLYEKGSTAYNAAQKSWEDYRVADLLYRRGGAVTSAQSGLDYVPYNNYPASLHRGESVITAQGNKALQMILEKLSRDGGSTQPINIYVSDLVDIAIEGGSNLAIRKIKSNPEVLRR
jgi:hypothetical protein